MMEFSRTLTGWYLRFKRDLPWRREIDPYKIWLSEVILQQTRVAQGLPYYHKFTQLFPDVFALAAADEQQVMLAWQGLGYYSRARNLHAAAKAVANNLNGGFPANFQGLLKLPGVGEYTAAAIASFAYGEKQAVVDGNVFRVLSRVFGIETDIASPAAKKEFTALALELMGNSDPALFNQAIMEFGALQCVPKNPDCGSCPFNSICVALQARKVHSLPVKQPKSKPKDRFLHYFVIEDAAGNTLVSKRSGPGIWRHLFEFPHLETPEPASQGMILREASARYGAIDLNTLTEHDVLHKLSHQNLHIGFSKITVEGALEQAVHPSKLHELPFPAVLYNFIEKHWN